MGLKAPRSPATSTPHRAARYRSKSSPICVQVSAERTDRRPFRCSDTRRDSNVENWAGNPGLPPAPGECIRFVYNRWLGSSRLSHSQARIPVNIVSARCNGYGVTKRCPATHAFHRLFLDDGRCGCAWRLLQTWACADTYIADPRSVPAPGLSHPAQVVAMAVLRRMCPCSAGPGVRLRSASDHWSAANSARRRSTSVSDQSSGSVRATQASI